MRGDDRVDLEEVDVVLELSDTVDGSQVAHSDATKVIETVRAKDVGAGESSHALPT